MVGQPPRDPEVPFLGCLVDLEEGRLDDPVGGVARAELEPGPSVALELTVVAHARPSFSMTDVRPVSTADRSARVA